MSDRSFWETIRFTLKILLLCWILHDAAQYATQRIIMSYVYPAQSYKGRSQQKERMEASIASLMQLNGKCQIHPVLLEKNGLQMNGWTLCDPSNKDNGKWVLQAVGNNAAVEFYLPKINEQYAAVGFNTLLINNPGVGNSQGIATPKTMGAVQSLALTYLEKEQKATHIVLAGHSLGGAAIGQAILQHEFKPNIQYLVIQQMTFGTLSNAARRMNPKIKSFARPLIRWAGVEMDTVSASRKLAELNIDEYVINRQDLTGYTHDGVIPGKATLGHRLRKASITHRKITNYPNTSLDFAHNAPEYIQLTAKIIDKWDNKSIAAQNL